MLGDGDTDKDGRSMLIREMLADMMQHVNAGITDDRELMLQEHGVQSI